MTKREFQLIEKYMQECMQDSAHDEAHVYRVLYTALDIAEHEKNVDDDVLITASLLHDIGRREQAEDPSLCHAVVGAEKAHCFLCQNGYSEGFSSKVAACIKAHRFRSDNPPVTVEEKILFDADKIDAAGAVGIARTLIYKGQESEPLYSVSEMGEVLDGSKDTMPSFFREYKFKLEGLYAKFYTERGKEIASQRQIAAVSFYENMRKEIEASYQNGGRRLSEKFL